MQPVDFLIFANVGIENANSPSRQTMKPWRSLGPSKIASRLRLAGYTVQIINFSTSLTYDELKIMTTPFVDKNTVIGVSTTFLFDYDLTQNKETPLVQIVKEFKDKLKCTVMLGGPTPEYYKERFNADIVIHGFAENKIIEIANNLKNHGIIKNRVTDWDILSCNHKWHDSDRIQQGETLPLEISRGCIFKCSYCKYEYIGKKRGEYVRDMSMIRDEILENYEKYKVTNYMLMDDTFNDDVYKMEEWCKMVDSLPFNMTYTAYCRADLLWSFQDIAKELHRCGLHGTTLGLETLNKTAAKAIGKSWSAKHGRDFIPYYIHDICKGHTLTQVNFIIGLPGDTTEDIWDFLHWAKDSKVPAVATNALTITNPKFYPNETAYSDFDKNAEKYGYRFPNRRLPIAWENDLMNWSQARKINKEAWGYIVENFNDGSWSGFAALSLGYTLEEVLSKTIDELYNDPVYISRTQNWFDKYKDSFK
jgi:radical SAM superfamily enzyme YgiQ (UPF0313 family)